MFATPSRLRRLAARIRRAYAEVAYAQRRLFELRTGISLRPTPRRAPRCRTQPVSLAELEALYELDHPGQADRV